jgi:gliding motility-associated-like protein
LGRKFCITLIILLVATLKLAAQNLQFIENKGQWDSRARFMGDLQSGSFFLERNGFTVVLHNPDDVKKVIHRHHLTDGTVSAAKIIDKDSHAPDAPAGALTSKLTVHSHAYNMRFEGGAAQPQIIPDKKLPGYNNYLLGNDPSKWASNCATYQAVVYKNVYPNVDVRYYTESGQLKYDLIVNPGGDVEKIALKYDGVDKLAVKNGELMIKTSVGEVKELSPYSYQFPGAGKSRQQVECNYELKGNTVKFKVKSYDKNSVLVIDPTLIFSSFTGSHANQFGFTATPAPDGSLFSGGIVFGTGFPVSPGAYQTNFGGGSGVDMGIFKFSPFGDARVYATYIGGNDDDFPHSLISDNLGNLVILGRSYSGNYPGTLVGNGGFGDIVVTKLNATGTGLIGSLRIGGNKPDGVNIVDQQRGSVGAVSILRNYGDDSRSEVVLDDAGFIYVAAQTQSSGTQANGGFPVTAGVFQSGFGGGTQDAAVIKINPNCNSIVFSSYLGGNGNDGAYGIKVNPVSGDIYVAGATESNNFPGNASGTIGSGFAGGPCDGYVTIISNNGATQIKSTFLGTDKIDVVYALQFDNLGFPYVMGITKSDQWPVLNAAYSNAKSKQFIAKLKPDLSAYVYSTVFGSGAGSPNISPVAFLVDRCENVYASGWGGWIDNGQDQYDLAGTSGMPITPDAIKSTTDNKDFYFIVLKKDASALLYGSFFGQNGGEGEHVDGGTSRFDKQGAIYQAICANCLPITKPPSTPYPITPNVVGPQNLSGDGCNLAAAKIAFNFAGVEAGPKSLINGRGDTSGCVPLLVNFTDTLQLAKTYEWDFNGDGITDTVTATSDASFVYNAVGVYRVRLIAVDSTTCNIRDTAYLTIRARSDRATLSFTAQKQGACESLEYQFINTSVPPGGKPFKNNSFIWDFGDNTPRVTTGPLPVNHTYAAAGNYTVRLILVDTNYCNAPDTARLPLRIAPLVDARFVTPPAGCVPYNAVFNNTSIAGMDFLWKFGDGTTSTDVSPTHLYNNPGTYTIWLIAVDSSTCNKIDSASFTITVNIVPTAAFTFAPVPAQENTPTTFFNNSIGGSRYKWVFGDGESTTKTNMDTVMHQYNATTTYQACLITINQFGCADTVCQPVQSIIRPLLDVPNAFTPGRPGNRGKNHIVRVEGFGLQKVMFRIYNRWGQKVFETTDPHQGWDGTFRGVLQPMDVYVYTLEAEFTDGTRVSRKGDITLIR